MNRLLRRTAGIAACATAAVLIPIAAAIPAAAAVPANDVFSNAITLVSGTAYVGDNTNATTEASEPSIYHADTSAAIYACYGLAGSIWYKIPDGITHIHIAVTNEGFDGAIGVFSTDKASPDVTDLTGIEGVRPLASADQLSLDADLQTTLANYVELDGCNVHNDGPLQARDFGITNFTPTLYTAPTNDSYAGAQVLPGASGTVNGDNTGATFETNENRCHSSLPSNGYSSEKSVWYQWTAPQSAIYRFSTAGTSFPSNFCLGPRTPQGPDFVDYFTGYTGEAEAHGDAITGSFLQFTAAAGSTWSIRVDGGGASGSKHFGPLKLTYGFAPDTTPPALTFASPAPGSTIPVGTANFTVSTNAVDTGSGVKQVAISAAGSTQIVTAAVGGHYSAIFSLVGESPGQLTITAQATDNANNVSAVASEVVNLGGAPAGYAGATSGAGKSPVKATGVTTTGFTKTAGLNGKQALKSAKKGSKITIRFFGKGLALHFVSFKGAGIITVTLDGKKHTFDLYKNSAKGKDKVENFLKLVRGKHTAVITVTGLKNSKATGAAVVLWLFSVGA